MLLLYTFIYIFVIGFERAKTIESNIDKLNKKSQILIVISYDGFRNEYFHRNVTPNLLKFRNEGVSTRYMMNVFPTKTFPNHHSISTGFYAGFHGILANSLFDLKQGSLNYSYELFHYNPKILPIWSLNEKSGGTSGCMMWPGSNFKYSGISCTHTSVYDSNIPLFSRVDTMMSWLMHPEKPANLVMLYSEQPDKLAHITGPESKNITDMVEQLDLLNQYILNQLDRYKITDRVNIIHLSDHGMASVNPLKFINITQHLEPGTFAVYGTSPVLQVVPIKDKEKEIWDILLNLSKINGNFAVYDSSNIKERWHAKNVQRFGPIIIVANIGYAFDDMWKAAKYYKEKFNIPITDNSLYGIHGYDNEEELMHPIFMAKGPMFKARHEVKPFLTVDLFQLFKKVLNINEDDYARNGSFIRIEDVLAASNSSQSNILLIIFLSVVSVTLGTYVYSVYAKHRRRQRFNIML